MLRSAAGKVMWVGRATVFLVGLAVILALLFGVASTALGADGKPFLLGKQNVATQVSKLIKRGDGPALSLQVREGHSPMKVNSSGKVANLNADQLDGNSETDFYAAGSKVADSEQLDGKDSADFANSTHSHPASDVNDGPGSGLDADTLDGLDSADLALDVTIRSTTFTIPANTFRQGAARCESGETAISGGFDQDLGGAIEVSQNIPYNPSGPAALPDRWMVGGFNKNTDESTYLVFAVCAKR